MNTTNLKRILALHREGVSGEDCLAMIIGLSKSPREAAKWIWLFLYGDTLDTAQSETQKETIDLNGIESK